MHGMCQSMHPGTGSLSLLSRRLCRTALVVESTQLNSGIIYNPRGRLDPCRGYLRVQVWIITWRHE